jgi:hypothetical protein
MSEQSSSLLALPYILPSQAQKHVTHNEALRMLDALVQLAVEDRDLTEPPAIPSEGSRYIVATGAGGAWSGRDGMIAAFQDGAWSYFDPKPGWLAWVADEAALFCRDGAGWRAVEDTLSRLQNLSRLGVGTTADAANPFSAKLNTALWTAAYAAEGGSGDLRYTMNKEAAANTVSLLMQDNWSGRAEIGLTGDDRLSLKMSPDGTGWTTAMTVDAATARPCFPQGLAHASGAANAQYIPTTPGNIWRLDASRPGTPRTFTLSAVSDTTLTLSTATANQIFDHYSTGLSAVRVWNTSKTPAEPAWIVQYLASTDLQASAASDIAGWSSGDTIQVGDPNPTGDNTLQMAALDISGYLQTALGSVFPQKGVLLSLYVASSDGPSGLDFSGSGAGGTAQGGNALSEGTRNQMTIPIVTPTLSPISNSNLLFVREQLTGVASDLKIAFARILGVYA